MRKAGGGYVWVSITAVWTRESDGRIDVYAIHSSVESIIEHYDFAYSGMQKPSTVGMSLYMFAVTFEGGNPGGYSIFDENGVRLSGLDDASLSDALLGHGIINADSEAGLRDLYDSIVQGEKYGGMLVLCSGMYDGVLHWARISYVMTYDESGLPLRASGNIRELPHIATAQGRFFREEKLFEAVGSQMLRSARIDLTTGLVEKVIPESLGLDGVAYESFVTNATAKYCYADDAVGIMRLVTRENVLRMISEGTFQLTKEFRRDEARQRPFHKDGHRRGDEPTPHGGRARGSRRGDARHDYGENVELRGAMETLRGQGFRFALDDLGSEYSTLSAMSDLPFDTVKLDRLLVKRFADDSMSRSIVEGIARACEKNGIRCVAEGVEFPSCIEPLVSMGCRYGQGYCFARPMTVDQFANEYLVDASDDAERTIPIPKGDGE